MKKNEGQKVSEHFLYPLFFPRNIVVVGASPNPNMGVSLYLNTYKNYGYGIERKPEIYPVNPKYEGKKIFGLWKCYKDLKSIPEPIDYVISCINAKYVSDLLRECIEVDARFLIIYTSGFSEVGKRGMSYTNEIKEILEESNYESTRVVGPNCFGAINSQIDLNFNQFAEIHPGSFSLFSQSGGFANRTVEISKKRGLGLNFGISVGNMIDLDMNDFLDFFSLDLKTNVIGLYLETVKNKSVGRKFYKKLKSISEIKPIVVLKGGKTKIGARSAVSHTGAIAGQARIYEAVFKNNAISVNSSIEFYDIAYLLTLLFPDKLLKSRKTCLIVPGGGNTVEMSDILSNISLEFIELSEKTQRKLSNLLYDVNTGFENPIDVGAYGILPEMLLNTTKIIIKEEQEIDNIIIVIQLTRILGLALGYDKFAGTFARSLGRISRKTKKNLFLIPMLDQYNPKTIAENKKLKSILNKYRIPNFPTIDRLAKSLEYYLNFYKL
ncbi:MAG: hypothetical protein GF329_08580 [Candidatus Lokiarchaeota archaeon]|nr:hypothetical protein [Candidatus Lokiarchaeota archaeon]